MQEFRTPQVASLTGASFRQLDYWSRNGILTPSIADARGSGSVRIYSLDDVRVAAVLVRLSWGQGCPVPWAAVVTAVRRSLADGPAGAWAQGGFLLVSRSGDWRTTFTPGADLAELGGVAWVIDLGAVALDLDRMLNDLRGCAA